jgi:signal transduction histidine kinase
MTRLAPFIRENTHRILEEWLQVASRLPSAHGLGLGTLRDHMPELIDTLAEAIERGDTTATPMKGLPNLHAALRVREGYDLRQVVAEYRMLRRVIHELYSTSGAFHSEQLPAMDALRVMDQALDGAISDAVDQYAVDRDRSREMFIGILGHDLREPMSTIIFGLQSLLERHGEHLPAPAVKSALLIKNSARRMERMIRDLLDFAHGRLGSGLPVTPAPIDDARTVISETVHEIAQANPDRRIVCLGQSARGDFSVRWDSDRIAQAITNLVSNAISYGEDPVVVEPVDEHDRIAIEVRNRGDIPRAILPGLFDPFTLHGGDRRHHEESRTEEERRRGHLGLGLYIVRAIAEAHGGEVAASSDGGEAVFRMTLPRDALSSSQRKAH